MTWILHHSKSEQSAAEAEATLKQGQVEAAERLYTLAAEEEMLALNSLEPSRARTLGITAVSAASLLFKANELKKVELIAYQWLSTDLLPPFAMDQLQAILQDVWNERVFRRSGVQFAKGQVLVSVEGGEVVTGAAPLDLIQRKVEEVRSLFYRTIEWLMRCPFRRRGAPSPEIQEQFRPWLLQAPAGSYQFAVRVQKPAQLRMFPDAMPKVEEVTQKFMEIVDATAQETPDELVTKVPDSEYRESFLKLSRNLAPSGKSFSVLKLRSSDEIYANPITLFPGSRHMINRTLKRSKRRRRDDAKLKHAQIAGVLRGLHLDKDWLEITTIEPNQEPIRVYETGDIIDDVVGPMVNQRVVVDVLVQADGKHIFRDIQPED